MAPQAAGCRLYRRGAILAPQAAGCRLYRRGAILAPLAARCRLYRRGAILAPQAARCRLYRREAILAPQAAGCRLYCRGAILAPQAAGCRLYFTAISTCRYSFLYKSHIVLPNAVWRTWCSHPPHTCICNCCICNNCSMCGVVRAVMYLMPCAANFSFCTCVTMPRPLAAADRCARDTRAARPLPLHLGRDAGRGGLMCAG